LSESRSSRRVTLLVSEHTPLFGFMESGYRLAIVLTLVLDGLTIALLGAFVARAAARRLRALLGAGTSNSAGKEGPSRVFVRGP
jgi:hypothetical protein